MANEQKFYDLTELSTEQPDLYSHVFSATGNFKVSYNNLLDFIRSMRTPKIVNLKRVNNVPVGIALNDTTIAVCNSSSNNVTIYSQSNLELLATITVTGCMAIAYVPSLDEYWVTGHASNIYRINALTYTTSTLACANSKGIAVNEATNEIYIGGSGTIYKSNGGSALTDLTISMGGQNCWYMHVASDGNVWFNTNNNMFGSINGGRILLSPIGGAIVEIDSGNLLLAEKGGDVRVFNKSTGTTINLPTGNFTNNTTIADPTTLKGVKTSNGKLVIARRLSTNLGRSFLQIIDPSSHYKQEFLDIGIGSIGDMAYNANNKQLYLTDVYNSQIIQIDLTGY